MVIIWDNLHMCEHEVNDKLISDTQEHSTGKNVQNTEHKIDVHNENI